MRRDRIELPWRAKYFFYDEAAVVTTDEQRAAVRSCVERVMARFGISDQPDERARSGTRAEPKENNF